MRVFLSLSLRPGHLRWLNPQVSDCASEVGPLSLHTSLLPGFYPVFLPLPTAGKSEADTTGTCTITYGALPPTRLNVFL